jgi:hypothetical protein
MAVSPVSVAAATVTTVVVPLLALRAMGVRVLAGMAMGRHAPTLTRNALGCRNARRSGHGLAGRRFRRKIFVNSRGYAAIALELPGDPLARFGRLRTLGHV